MFDLMKQIKASMGSDSMISRLNLGRPIESGLETVILFFTDHEIPRCVSIVLNHRLTRQFFNF